MLGLESWVSLFKSSENNKIYPTSNQLSQTYDCSNGFEKTFTEKNLSIKSDNNIINQVFIEKFKLYPQDMVNKQYITLNTDLERFDMPDLVSKDNDPNPIFTPFTPNTLNALNHEIDTTDKAVKHIIKNTEDRELSLSTARKLSSLLAEQEYFFNQHKTHLEAIINKSNQSLESVENKLSYINIHENKLNEMKNNLMDYKCKLIQDINKPILNHDSNDLSNTRNVSTGNWKKYLSQEEIKLIDSLDNKVLKDTIKNRIELEKKH